VEQQAGRWTAVDEYLEGIVVGNDAVLQAALDDAARAGLPQIQVTPLQGRLLFLLARMVRARRILEVGTLGGYSTICLARALPPGGSLVTLEIEARHAEVARANIARAGLADVVDVRLGRALDTLADLEKEGGEPFDLVFIDADKANNAGYFRSAMTMSRPGTVIVVDNAIRRVAIAEPGTTDPDVVGTRAVLELMGKEPRVSATAIQTVGSKGYDGFALAVVGD
jgi:predicted O-methyltransferase YrrM